MRETWKMVLKDPPGRELGKEKKSGHKAKKSPTRKRGLKSVRTGSM